MNNMKPFLIVDGVKRPVSGISYDDNGNIRTIQIVDGYKIVSYYDIASNVEGAKEIDFATCYIEEQGEVKEKLNELIVSENEELDEMAHTAIPPVGAEYTEHSLVTTWWDYYLKKSYIDGLKDASVILEGK